jgi:hypothetical protein
LRNGRGVAEGSFSVVPFFPEQFIHCSSRETRDTTLAASSHETQRGQQRLRGAAMPTRRPPNLRPNPNWCGWPKPSSRLELQWLEPCLGTPQPATFGAQMGARSVNWPQVPSRLRTPWSLRRGCPATIRPRLKLPLPPPSPRRGAQMKACAASRPQKPSRPRIP